MATLRGLLIPMSGFFAPSDVSFVPVQDLLRGKPLTHPVPSNRSWWSSLVDRWRSHPGAHFVSQSKVDLARSRFQKRYNQALAELERAHQERDFQPASSERTVGPASMGRHPFAVESSRPPTPLRLIGELPQVSLLRLLEAASRRTLPGDLRMEGVGWSCRLIVSREDLIVLDSGAPELRLGSVLVEGEVLEVGVLLGALEQQLTDPRALPLGRLLLEEGLVELRQLRWALAHQAEQVLARARALDRAFLTYESPMPEADARLRFFRDERLALPKVLARTL